MKNNETNIYNKGLITQYIRALTNKLENVEYPVEHRTKKMNKQFEK